MFQTTNQSWTLFFLKYIHEGLGTLIKGVILHSDRVELPEGLALGKSGIGHGKMLTLMGV